MQRFFIAVLGTLAFWAAPVLARAASPEVIEGAKKEGEVVWYGGGSGEIDEVLGKNFSKKYPFLQVKKTRIQSQRLLVRFETESKAGKHVADIVRTTDWYIDIFKQKGLLMKYESPERKAFINELKDRDGYYTALYKQLHAIAYNTRMVRKQDLPRSYDGLLEPKWKGQLGLEDAAYVWFVNMLKIRGESQGIEFMKKLGHDAADQRGGGRGDSPRDRHLRLHGRPREEKWRADRLSCRRTRDRAHNHRRHQQEHPAPQRRQALHGLSAVRRRTKNLSRREP